MIKGRKHSENIMRIRQEYDTRLDKVRLGMNEHVPNMPDELFNEIISGYTNEEASAYPELNLVYNSLANYINQPRDRILLASGADMAIKITLESFCEKDDIVLTCAPTFAMYKIHTELLGCKLQEILSDNSGEFNLKQLIYQGKKGIKVVILANPNGVTGFYFSLKELKLLLSELSETIVILDETYADFANLDATPLLEEFDNLIIIRSFSKNIGFAGLRIGYIIAQEYVAGIIEKFRPMMEISSLAARAIKVLCSEPNIIKKLANEVMCIRSKFAKSLRNLGFDVIEKGGNFVLVNFGSKKDAVKAVLIRNNIEFKSLPSPMDNYIRFTIANTEIMNNVLKIISMI